MFDYNKIGKGAIPTPKHIKNKHYRLAAEPPRVIDWSKEYKVEQNFTLKQRDQDGSSSCTAQATMYYCEALEQVEHKKEENYSARFNYSQTWLPPDGGSYIWKAMSLPLKVGCVEAKSVPDKMSREEEMRDASDNHYGVLEARADKYAVIDNNHNIDRLAAIVEDYQGFVTGFNGNNTIVTTPILAIPDHTDWGHAVYVCGYKLLPDGRKALIFKNSWGPWGDGGYGYFTEDFVKSGFMFDAYVYADIQDLDNNMTQEEVRLVYVLAFYREPDAGELTFWTGKKLQDFLKQAITDRSAFLAKEVNS